LAVEIEGVKDSLLDARHRGVRTRFITEITKDNISYCKELITFVDEVRHLGGIKGSFYINDLVYLVPTELHEKGKPASEIIYSNVRELVEHQQYIFDTLWNKSILAQEKINEIEKGIESETFEVITDTRKATHILVDLAKSVKEEALFLLPADKSMIRVDRLGVIDCLIKASQNGANVKIICPLTEENLDLVNRIRKSAPDIRILNGHTHTNFIELTDSTRFLRCELKTPDAKEFSEAIGFTLYSNSKPSVDSFVSIFEVLWKQTEMYEKSQEKLHSAEDELANMKQYLNEVLDEIATIKKPVEGSHLGLGFTLP
jgi:two-component system sensor histidine kinase VicK